MPAVFYISSYFWDRATDIGIIRDSAAISVSVKPSDFRLHGESACSTPVAGLGHKFPAVQPQPSVKLFFLYVVVSANCYSRG